MEGENKWGYETAGIMVCGKEPPFLNTGLRVKPRGEPGATDAEVVRGALACQTLLWARLIQMRIQMREVYFWALELRKV